MNYTNKNLLWLLPATIVVFFALAMPVFSATPTPPPNGSGVSVDCSKLEQNFTDFGGSSPGPLAENCYSPGQAVTRATRIAFTLVGILAALFIVIGGYQIMSGSKGFIGDKKEQSYVKGKKTILWAVVGLVLVLVAYMIVTVVTRLVTTDKLF